MSAASPARSPSAARHRLLDGAIAAACAAFPLFVWRWAPLAVFVVTTAASATLMARSYPGGPAIGPTIALYLLAASRASGRPWTRRTTLVVVGMFCLHVGAFSVGHGGKLPEIQLAIGALVWGLAWFAGERTRLRRQEVADLEQRAVQAEREAIQNRRLAVAEERVRIARDLHDSATKGSGGRWAALVGMWERAALLGSEVEAGRMNGGFRVRARLPCEISP